MKSVFLAVALMAAIPTLSRADVSATESPDNIDSLLRRRVECVVENARGMRFEGMAFSRREAEREAFERCRRVSRHCELRGCFER